MFGRALSWRLGPIQLTSAWCRHWEKALAPHSSTLAWRIPWMEEPGRLQSMWSLRDWTTSLSLFTFMHWRRQCQPTPVCLENPRDGGAWWAAVSAVAQSWTRLKRLSSSSSSGRGWKRDQWTNYTEFQSRKGPLKWGKRVLTELDLSLCTYSLNACHVPGIRTQSQRTRCLPSRSSWSIGETNTQIIPIGTVAGNKNSEYLVKFEFLINDF